MRYGSVCSGIEAATVAWKPLGWEAAWFSEIEKFPCAVLQHHYPDVPNLGDITQITEEQLHEHGPIDILVGGTPCQSFSVAGLRKGMADPRGNLALRFIQLAHATRARWVVWENVPGVLSSSEGRDFGALLRALAEVGYGFAYRILDAQYFGVPQRRRRVFVVGYLGDWRRAAAVLFERESLLRYPPPSRKATSDVAGTIDAGSGKHRGAGINPGMLAAATLNSGGSNGGFRTEPGEHLVPVEHWSQTCGCGHDFTGPLDMVCPACRTIRDGVTHGDPIAFDTTQVTSPGNYSQPKPGDACHPLAEGQHPPAIAFNDDQSEQTRSMGEREDQTPTLRSGGSVSVAYRTTGNDGVYEQGDKTAALNTATDPTQNIVAYQCQGTNVGPMGHLRTGNGHVTGGVPFVADTMAVRRLTPLECERLQGFPDGFTNIPYGRPKYPDQICPDGPRYKALGNSMAVPVMRWLGERIAVVETETSKQKGTDG